MRRKYEYQQYKYLDGVSGIYEFYNIITNKRYIGRSHNIYLRIGEHLRHSNNINDSNYNSHFYKALRKYDMELWIIKCLYYSSENDDLVQIEREYIEKYDSVKNGYNSTYETNSPPIRNHEEHSNALLTNKEVEQIREEYNNIKSPEEVYKQYENKIAYDTFINIWRGYTWNGIHMDVYTEENKRKHKLRINKEQTDRINSDDRFKITRDCVYKIRELYAEEKLSPTQVYEKFNFLNRNTFNDIWYGHTFPDIYPPEYMTVKNRKRKFIRKGNNKQTMFTKITKTSANWTDVKNECRNTVNKEETNTHPSKDFIKKVLISEHSPIRLVKIKWRWEGIKSWISVHFARHWLGWDKWVSTQRTDRTGVNRDEARQDTPVNMDIEANAQALINVGRYRLCHQAAKETREYMEDLKKEIKNKGQTELSNVLVPNCIYRCGCPEFTNCGYITGFRKWLKENNKEIDWFNIQNRYDLYNEYFYITRGN